MHTKLFTLILALWASIATIFAENVQIGLFYYNLNPDSLTAELTYKERGENANYSYLTKANIPASVTYNGISYNVTTIGRFAFEYCNNLTSVTIPYGVTTIEEGAFSDCKQLVSVTLPESVTSIMLSAFAACPNLVSMTIPNSVTFLDGSVFHSCTGLTSVTLPDSLTNIPFWTFYGCSSLRSIELPPNITLIEDYAFYDCKNLTSIEIPNHVTTIYHDAFGGCTGLQSVTCYAMRPPTTLHSWEKIFGVIDLTKLTVFVPANSINLYASNRCWKDIPAILPISAETLAIDSLKITPTDKSVFVAWDSVTNAISYKITIRHTNDSVLCTYMFDENGQLRSLMRNAPMRDRSADPTPSTGFKFEIKGLERGKTYNYSLIATDAQDSVLSIKNGFFTTHNEPVFAISALPSNPQWGRTKGDTMVYYLDTVVLTAEPFYGYHFSKWNDRDTQNPRQVIARKNTTYTAFFAKNIYDITKLTTPGNSGSITGKDSAFYLDTVSLTAVSSYGYSFVGWSDNQTEKTRSFVITQDTSFTAVFTKNPTIKFIYNETMGTIVGDSSFTDMSEDYVTFLAQPNSGYHFTQWSDGIKDNPRTIYLTHDTTLTALFEPNLYTVVTTSDNPGMGYTTGDTVAPYGTRIDITAVPYYGYYFAIWSDGNHQSTRTITLRRDVSLTAFFEKEQYIIQPLTDSLMGTIVCVEQALYLDTIEVMALPEEGFLFVKWEDGTTDNPRTIVITQDTTLTAIFASNSCTVQFFGFNNNLLESQIVEYGTSAIAPEAPQVDHYDFVGWDKDFSCIQSDLDVYAIYTPNTENLYDVNTGIAIPSKIIRDNQIHILRGEHTYTLQGQEVQ